MKNKIKSFAAVLLAATLLSANAYAAGIVKTYNGNNIELQYNDVTGEFTGTRAANFSKDNSPLASQPAIDYMVPDEINGTALKSIPRNGFFDCDTMKSIKLPKGLVSIGEKAFLGCDMLESIDIPDSVTSLDSDIFESCDSLASASVGSGVSEIPAKLFYSCKNLKTVTMSDNVTSIGSSAFAGCKSLENITLSSNLKELSDSVFKDCALTEIEIPKGVTRIPSNAFSGCKSLRSIVIPEDVISIDKNAFKDCISLKVVKIGPNCKTIDKTAFDGCKNVTISCVSGSKAALFALENKFDTSDYNDDSNITKKEYEDTNSQISITDDNYKYTDGGSGIALVVNGKQVDCGNAEPVIQNGSTLVPMRPLLSAIGTSKLEYDKDTKTVKCSNDDVTVSLTVGNDVATVNGASVKMSVAPQIINSSTYIPARFVSETFGCEVKWDAETKTVSVVKK